MVPLPFNRRTLSLLSRGSTASERERARLLRALRRGLKDLERRAETPGVHVLEMQLLAQIVGRDVYAGFKRSRERAWTATRHSTSGWPRKLADGEYAVLLLPLPAGRVGSAVGKYPVTAATPVFATGRPAEGRSYDDLVLGSIASWVCSPAEGISARLGPPVIEVVGRRGVVERRIESFGLSWPLPAPDGV